MDREDARREVLKGLLARAVVDPLRSHSCLTNVTRRQFVGGAAIGGVAAAAIISDIGRSQPIRDVLVVTYGGVSWRLDLHRFANVDVRRRTYEIIGAPDVAQVIDLSLRYPGTDFVLKGTLEFLPRLGTTIVRVSLRGWPIQEFKFADWAADPSGFGTPRLISSLYDGDIRIDGGSRVSVGSLRMSLDSQFNLVAEATRFPIDVRAAPFRAVARRFAMSAAQAASATLAAIDPRRRSSAVTNIQFGQVEVDKSTELSRVDIYRVGLEGWGLLTLEAFDRLVSGRSALVLLAARSCALSFSSGSQIAMRVKLARAAFLGLLYERSTLLAGYVGRQGISAGSFSVEVEGAPEPFYQQLDGDGSRGIEFQVGLISVHAPVADANSCEVEYRGSQARLTIGASGGVSQPIVDAVRRAQALAQIPNEPPAISSCAPAVAAKAPERPLPTAPHVHLGPSAFVEGPLDRAVIRLRRSVDLFDLGFRFPGQFLSVHQGETAILAPRKSPPLRWIVEFPPQHIEEEAFSLTPRQSKPLPDPTEDLTINFETPPRYYGDTAEDAGEPQLALARTAASGPSRLAFTVANPAPRTPVTVETLTSWRNLSLAVHERALRADATLEEELALLRKPGEADLSKVSRAEMKQRVRDLLEKPLGKTDTALELVTGLIISPDDRGRFETPARPSARGAEMWTAQFNAGAGSRARAILAPDMYLGFIDPRQQSSPTDWHNIPDVDDRSPYALSMTRRDRRQIAIMSSGVGIAAMRRLTLDGFDDPSGMVVRPERAFAWLSEDKIHPKGLPEAYEEGIARPRAFDEFEAALSARGASVHMKARFEPYAPHVDKATGLPFVAEAGSLQSYRQEIGYGRDLEVEIVYKGFLFPLGFLVALVKLTEKSRGLPYRANAELDRPTAYNIQRLFIVATKPRRPFPGLYQPFSSRGSVVENGDLELVTLKTVDLDTPRQIKLSGTSGDETLQKIPVQTEKVQGAATGYEDRKLPSGRCFWPRANGEAIAFKYRVAGSESLASMPLIFLDNAVAHDAGAIETLAKLYNEGKFEQATPDYRDSKHGGAVRRYTVERTDGEASYKTIVQRIAVVGREVGEVVGADGTLQSDRQMFEMDPYMEGQDQPPFYPLVATAKIEVSSFDRLSGTKGDPVDVAFEETYLRHGFDPVHNPAEIYLRAINVSRDITFAGGTASGGVATPNIHFAALSRTQGLIGGGRLSPPPGPATAKEVTVIPAPQYDIRDALNGVFDARKFFGGSLIDARLMGDIKLWDLIAATGIDRAPVLREVSTIASDAAGEVAKVLKIALSEAIKVTSALDDVLNQLVHGYSLAKLYPELDQALKALKAALADAKAVLDGSPLEITDAALKVAEAGKALLAVLNAIAERPVPKSLQAAFDELGHQVDRIRALIDGAITGFGTGTILGPNGPLHAALMELARAGLFEVWFGPGALRLVPPTADQPAHLPSEPSLPPSGPDQPTDYVQLIERFLSNPDEALQSAAQGLFFETIGRPLLEGANRLARGLSDAGKLPWSRVRLREPILAAIGGLAGVLRAPNVAALAEDILDAVQKQLEPSFRPSADALRDPATLDREVRAQLDRRLAAMQTDVAKSLDSFWQGLGGLLAAADQAAKSDQSLKTAAQSALDQAPADQRAMLSAKLAQATAKAGLSQALYDGLTVLRKDSAAAALRRVQEVLARELGIAAKRIVFGVAEQAASTAERGVARLAAGAAGMLETAGALQVLTRAGEAASKICADANKVTDAATSVLSDVLAKSDKVVERVAKIRDTLTKFDVSRLPEQLRRPVAEAIADVSAGVERLISMVEQIERYRLWLTRPAGMGTDGWRDIAGPVCGDVAQGREPSFVALLEPSRALLDLRLRTVAAIGDLLGRMAALFDMVPSGSVVSLTSVVLTQADLETQVRAIADDLADLTRELTAIGAVASGSWSALVARAQAIGAGTGDIGAVADRLRVAATELDAKLATAKLNPRLRDALRGMVDVVGDIANTLLSLEREFAARALEALTTTAKLRQQLDASAASVVTAVVTPLLDLHKQAATQLEALSKLVDGANPGVDAELWHELIWQLGASGRKALADATAAIVVDRDALAGIGGDYASPSAKDLVARWGANDVGLARAAKILSDWLASLAGSVVSDAVKLLRDKVQAFIAELVPNKFHLGYDWDTELKAFPARDPIFSMDPGAELQGERPSNDLVLTSTVDVTLKPNGDVDREVTFTGAMRPFKVHLIGDAFDLVTLHFKGANFALDQTGDVRFRADLGRIELGRLLTFLKALDKYLKVGPVVVRPEVSPPGVSVHFETGFDELPIGAIIFKNVYLYIDALLPFDGRPAQFRAALGSPSKLIEIHYPPYYGGGFVAVLASVGGVIGFEIQLEFGASVSLTYSGFGGYGRIGCGIYLLQCGSGRVLEGYVLARGAGQLLCFSIVLSAEIRVRQEGNSGTMKGSATYSYSFSMGLFDIDVSVTCSHEIEGSDSGPGRSLDSPLSGAPAPSLIEQVFGSAPPPDPDTVFITRTVKNKHRNWRAYRAHLDI